MHKDILILDTVSIVIFLFIVFIIDFGLYIKQRRTIKLSIYYFIFVFIVHIITTPIFIGHYQLSNFTNKIFLFLPYLVSVSALLSSSYFLKIFANPFVAKSFAILISLFIMFLASVITDPIPLDYNLIRTSKMICSYGLLASTLTIIVVLLFKLITSLIYRNHSGQNVIPSQEDENHLPQ